jgi:TonB family protein
MNLTLVRHPLLILILMLGACASDPLATYRASMPPPLPAPTAEQLNAVHHQQQAARERRLVQGEQESSGNSSATISYLERPTGQDFTAVHPPEALSRGLGGRVVLECLVQEDGALACAVASEDPMGEGFGEAARRAAARFRVAPETSDGRRTVGATLSIPLTFRAE